MFENAKFGKNNGGGGSGETLTASQIKVLYESNENTNAFTDSEKEKLESLDNNGGGAVNWGAIGGTIADQTDLHSALQGMSYSIAVVEGIANSKIDMGDVAPLISRSGNTLTIGNGTQTLNMLSGIVRSESSNFQILGWTQPGSVRLSRGQSISDFGAQGDATVAQNRPNSSNVHTLLESRSTSTRRFALQIAETDLGTARIYCGSNTDNYIEFNSLGQVIANGFLDKSGGALHKLNSRTKATLGFAPWLSGQMYLCSDLEGGPQPVISDGTAWRIIQTTVLEVEE